MEKIWSGNGLLDSYSGYFPNRWVVIWAIGIILGFYSILTSSYYALLIIPVFLICLITFLKPAWGFLLAVILLPIGSVNYYLPVHDDSQINIQLINVITLPLLLAWLLTRMARIGEPYQKTGMEIPATYLGMIIVSSLLWNQSNQEAIWEAFRYVNGLILFILTVGMIQNKKILNWVLIIWIVAALLTATATIFAKIYGFQSMYIFKDTDYPVKLVLWTSSSPSLKSATTGRSGGFDVHNNIGSVLNMYLLSIASLLYIIKGFWKKFWLILLLISILAAQLCTMSRGALVAMLVGVVAFLFTFEKVRKYFIKYGYISLLFILVVAIGIYSYNFNRAVSRLSSSLDSDSKTTGLSYRFYIWEHAWTLYQESPFLGVGVGTIRSLVKTPHSHSVYFSVLFEFGLIGFFFFLWMMVVLFKTLKDGILKIKDSYYGYLFCGFAAGLVSYGVHSLIDFSINWRLFPFVYLGILFAIVRLGLQENENPSNVPI